jgi:hypothetical protein
MHGFLGRFILVFILFAHVAWSKSVTWKKYTFSIDYPSDWKEVKDFFGIPVTILGPFQANDSRPVIQIVPVAEKSLSFSDEEMKKWNANHEKNSREWMKKHNGKLQKIWPGILEKRKDGTKQLVGGLTYELNSIPFFEKIYYLACPGRTWNFKILINQGSKKLLPVAEKIVESFQCGK